ncbi:hypothetical protein OUZ56_024367 [Daphnia magna]|uniref:Uncharacterized protein n=1 Tax=Daphnia magna TaxID=35525 RepID=A0ABR0B0P3_9CRUS|nr:hypothetical protein OUZ56_024367 [Daphnia magna]
MANGGRILFDSSLYIGEIPFITLDNISGQLIFWLFDENTGQFLNSLTAEFFKCESTTSTDKGIILDQHRSNC